MLTGGLQGERPVAAGPLGQGCSPLSQEGHRGGSCSTIVIDLVGNGHLGQSVGEIEDLLPLAGGGAGSGALRPIRQVPDVSLRLRQLQSVAIAAALDDALPHDGTQPGDDNVQRPQRPGRGVVGPQGLNEGAVAHPGVLAAGEHGEQVKAPTAQGPALPGRRLRQESQAVRGGHEAILTHHREAVLHMPGPVATPATVLVAAAATGPRAREETAVSSQAEVVLDGVGQGAGDAVGLLLGGGLDHDAHERLGA